VKRLIDIAISMFGLIIASPVLSMFLVAIWLQDFRSPLYVAERVGKNSRMFRMIKLRSMVANASRTGVTSTAKDDQRITPLGRLVRALKLDEVTQLWNVLVGDMSVVGPRPNVVKWGVELYTKEEMRLLTVRPGVTDLASIVFADEGDILAGHNDPDLAYNQLIRPWKSRLALIGVDNGSVVLDLQLVWLTLLAIVSRRNALRGVQRILHRYHANPELIEIAKRNSPLVAKAPPGSSSIYGSA